MTWIFILFDLVAVWLLVKPSALLELWTAHRLQASDADRLIARLVGVIILWAQVTRWAGQARGTNARVTMHWVSIVIGVCALTFLGYHFVALLASKPNRQTQLREPKWRSVTLESEEETRARYRAAWQNYRKLRISFPLLLLGWLPFGYVVSAVFRFLRWNTNIVMMVLLAWIPFIPIAGWRWSFWQCPRCGHAFKVKCDLFFPKRCHYCNLPMWAESSDQ